MCYVFNGIVSHLNSIENHIKCIFLNGIESHFYFYFLSGRYLSINHALVLLEQSWIYEIRINDYHISFKMWRQLKKWQKKNNRIIILTKKFNDRNFIAK